MFGFLRSLRCWRSALPKLHRLVADNKVTAKKLQRCNIDHVDGDGRTIIYYAALFSSSTTLELIIKEVKRRDKGYLIHFPEINGTTALHMSLEGRLVYDQNMELNGIYNSSLPDYQAADRGNKEIIRLLIEAGANIYQADKRNLYPWHYLATPANQELLQMLGGTQEEFAFANSESIVDLYKPCPSESEVMADANKFERQAEVDENIVSLDAVAKKDEITGRTAFAVEGKTEKGITAESMAANQCKRKDVAGGRASDADRAQKWINVDRRVSDGDETRNVMEGNAGCFDQAKKGMDVEESVLYRGEKKNVVEIETTVDDQLENANDVEVTVIDVGDKEGLDVEEKVTDRVEADEQAETKVAVDDRSESAIDLDAVVVEIEEISNDQGESEELVKGKGVVADRPENAIDAKGTTIDQDDKENPVSEAIEDIDFPEVGRQVVVKIINALQPLAPYSFLLGVLVVNVIFVCLLRTLH